MRATPCIKDQRKTCTKTSTHVAATYLEDLAMECELRVIRACDSSMTEAEAPNEAEHAKVYHEHADTNDDDYLVVLEECMHVHG